LFIFSGLVAGFFHAVTTPDHVVALAPLAASERGRAWQAGMAWGAGHACSVACVGVLVLLLRDTSLFGASTPMTYAMTGGAPIAMGLWGLWRLRPGRPALHAQHAGTLGFIMGLLGSLVGNAQVLAILPMLTIASRTMAVEYLAAFVAGTILTLTGFGYGLGQLARRCSVNGGGLYLAMGRAFAVGAIAVGIYYMAGPPT
jgi:hypothetical protein